MRILCALAAVTLAAACSAGPDQEASRATGSAARTAGPVTYLALGDSVAAGAGADVPGASGYVPVLAGLLSDRLGCDGAAASGCPLQVRNLGISGATAATLLRSQLPVALELLAGADDVRLVTVTIGGNDVFGPVLRACDAAPERSTCPEAVTDAVRRAGDGIDPALAALTEAAEGRATVAVMTYFNPLVACRLAPLAPLAERVLEGFQDEPGLNDVLRDAARRHGAVVVEAGERLRERADFVGGSDCLHPSSAGHATIAQAFDEQVGQLVAER